MKRLRERVEGRSSPDERTPDPVAPSAPADSRASVIQTLRHHVAEGSRGRLRAHEIHEEGPLFDRGYLDSFSYVEFLAFIEHTYRVRIDDSQLAGRLSTIAAMAEHILQERIVATE